MLSACLKHKQDFRSVLAPKLNVHCHSPRVTTAVFGAVRVTPDMNWHPPGPCLKCCKLWDCILPLNIPELRSRSRKTNQQIINLSITQHSLAILYHSLPMESRTGICFPVDVCENLSAKPRKSTSKTSATGAWPLPFFGKSSEMDADCHLNVS